MKSKRQVERIHTNKCRCHERLKSRTRCSLLFRDKKLKPVFKQWLYSRIKRHEPLKTVTLKLLWAKHTVSSASHISFFSPIEYRPFIEDVEGLAEVLQRRRNTVEGGLSQNCFPCFYRPKGAGFEVRYFLFLSLSLARRSPHSLARLMLSISQ